jgi:UDP-N-acetyl-2-amino-2-deoxyglucuronate dehydrogenase
LTVGVGIVGSGFMGRTWANVAQRCEATSLVGVGGGRRSARLAADLGCRRYASVEELLEDPAVGLVAITSPPAVHAEQAIAAARTGKSVLVEKPMAQDVGECSAMVDACAEAGVVLGVVSQHRYRSAPRVARRLIDEGAIGRVRMVRVLGPETGWWDVEKTDDAWKLDPGQQTAYASWGAHACDLVRWFVGADPDLAFAVAGVFGDEPPPNRSVMATYRFANGAIAQLWMSYDIPSPGLGSGLQLLIVGSEGMIDLDAYGSVRLGRSDTWTVVHQEIAFDPLDPLDERRLEAYSAELADVASALSTGGRPHVDGEEGLATTAMLEAVDRSIECGAMVPLPIRRGSRR